MKRDITTKENIINWCQSSWTIRKMFEMAKEVLSDPIFDSLARSEYLKSITQEFISLPHSNISNL